MNNNDRINLIHRISQLEGLTDRERSALLGLLRESKSYGLVWEDKPEAVEERMQEELPVLREVPERALISDDKDAPNHILIEGDNLEALTTLAYTHEGKIDVIYIDPPYNTENKDFVYNDSFVDREDTYRHSKWLSFMSRRLRIAKQLLSDKGVIFISIDDNELAQLKLLCDEIFGEKNFINNISINMNSLSGVKMTHTINGKRYPAQKESLLLYRKSYLPLSLHIEKLHKGKWDKEYNLIVPTMNRDDFELFDSMSVDEVNAYFSTKSLVSLADYIKEESIDVSEEWLWDNAYRIFGSKSNRPLAKRNKYLEFSQQIVCYLNTDGNKRFFRSDYNKEARDPRIELVRAESNSAVFLSDNWTDISNDGGVAQEGGVTYPNGKKPLFLIKRILRAANIKNATILDFFAGSGTTLHATITLNEEDSGKRKCILVQMNEGNKKICENITYKRCLNVITDINNNEDSKCKNNLRYYKTDFVPREPNNRNKRALVAAATDLLCIKNDVYQEQTTFGGHKLKPAAARYFDDGRTQMLIIYNELAVDAFVEVIAGMEAGGRIKVYVFSNNRYAYADNFESVADKVEVCALPAAIYDAYQKVLKPRKRNGNAPAADTPFVEETTTEAEQGTFHFMEEGGEA